MLHVALFCFSFFLARHELVFSFLKFATDAFWNKAHTDLLQQASPLETQHCSSLHENVLFLCLCHASASLSPRLTIGLNHLFRNKFNLNTSNPIMSEFTWHFSCSVTGQAHSSHPVFPLGHCSFVSKQVASQGPAAPLAEVCSVWIDFK